MQCQGFTRDSRAIAIFRFKTDVLLHGTGAGILYKLTEGRFWYIKPFHAVIIEHRKLHVDELITDQNTGNGSLDTLLSEACHCSIEVGAFLQLGVADGNVVQQFETKSGPFFCLSGLVNHSTDQLGFRYIIRRCYRMKLLRIGITGLDDKLGAVALLFGLTDFGYGILPQLLRLFITVKTSDTQSAFNSLLALETSALNFLQVTGEVIL